MSTLACYLAGLCDHTDALVPGERGVMLCIAPNSKQAKITLDYAEATLKQSPILRQLIVNRTADALGALEQHRDRGEVSELSQLCAARPTSA